MEKLARGRSPAALIAMIAITCAVAHADSDIPPSRSARLGLAIASLDENWRESNAYRASGLMVVGVDPRGRAAKSGIVAGDVLVSVGSRTMREPSDLGHAERSLSPDKAVSIVLAREGGRMIKVFEIAPVGAASVVPAEPAAAAAPPVVEPAAEPVPLAVVAATAAASDTAASPAVVTTSAPASDAVSPPTAVAPTAAAANSALPPAAVATASATADTASLPVAPSALVAGSEQMASPTSAASDAAPSVTAAGTVGTQAATGGSASAPVALGAPAAVVALPVAAAIADPGASPAPSTATADSGGTPPESDEPAPTDLGVVGKSLTPDLATALGATGVEGVLVLEVAAASPADRSGLRAGDIIVKVGEWPVADMGELQRAAAASSSPVSVSTLRLGKAKVELVALDGPPPVPIAPPSQEQLLMDLRDEVRSLRREVQSLRKKLGK